MEIIKRKTTQKMRRIYKNADLVLRLSYLGNLGDQFILRFYTNNPSLYVQKTQDDVMDDAIKLDWDELSALGKGVLKYVAYNITEDSDFGDGTFDNSTSKTTDYYIVIENGETPPIINLVNELQNNLNDEIEKVENMERVVSEALNYLNTEVNKLKNP